MRQITRQCVIYNRRRLSGSGGCGVGNPDPASTTDRTVTSAKNDF
jgi:hypothetical protein